MLSKTRIGWVMLAALSVGCGPRLRPAADATADASEAPPAEAPVAQMTAQLDASKLDAHRKYNQSGQFMVDGLFFKDGLSQPATVEVTVHDAGGTPARSYDIELVDLAGANAKVEMWDDGFLSVFVPQSGAAPQLQTSNENVKAIAVPVPGKPGESSTCYLGKEVLEGQLRFALCELQTPAPVMTFVDAEAASPVAVERSSEAPSEASGAPSSEPSSAPNSAPDSEPSEAVTP